MRTRLDTLVRSAQSAGRAAGAFTCYDLTTAAAVVAAAADRDEGVVLLVSPSTAATTYGQTLVRALRTLADHAPVPVSIQLDHAGDLDLILRTVEAGADAVLVDGSKGGYAANVALVLQARELLADHDVALEAELGRIEGNEDVAALVAAGAAGLTDPAQAKDFVAQTGVDLLAVSIGNVHGSYLGDPVIDHERLDDIAAEVDLPLVLHGASGLSPLTVRRCITSGVGKINVNTELRTAVLERLAATVPAALAHGANLESVMRSWSDEARNQVSQILSSLVAE